MDVNAEENVSEQDSESRNNFQDSEESNTSVMINNEEQTNVPKKRSFDDMDEDGKRNVEDDREDGLLCPVCLDAWTNAGPHRLCSLKCGHLFGMSCVLRWLGTRQKGCPSCNTVARKSDIREIYASKLIALDTAELENLRLTCVKQEREIQELKNTLALKVTVADLYKKLFEEKERELQGPSDFKPLHPQVISSLEAREMLSLRLEEGVCRVMAHCPSRDIIAFSQEHVGPLWPGFGFRLYTTGGSLTPVNPIHKKELRDLCFHPTNPDLLLTVAFDKQIKVFDLSSNKVVFSWTALNRIWSCCWDSLQSTNFYLGTERGQVVKLDMASGAAPIDLPLGKVIPVAVIALKSSRRLGCQLCCTLLSLSAYFPEGNETYRFELITEGKFSAMTFGEEEGMEITLVLTSKPQPHSGNRVRHQCFRLEMSEGQLKSNLVQVLIEGDLSSQLSRPCLLPTSAGYIFFAFNETTLTVCGWYVGQERKVVSIKTHCFVRDLMAVQAGQKLYILTQNRLKCYQLI